MNRFLQGGVAALLLVLASLTPSKATPVEIPQDIIFLIDSGSSIGNFGYVEAKGFFSHILPSCCNDPAHPVRFAALRYGSTQSTYFSLNDGLDPASALSILSSINYVDQGPSYTGFAVDAALAMFADQSSPLNPKSLFLLTDATITSAAVHDPCARKPALDAAGVETTIIGIGAQYFQGNALGCLVDDPSNNIFAADDFTHRDYDFAQGYVETVVAMPAPGTIAILALGIAGIAASRRRA